MKEDAFNEAGRALSASERSEKRVWALARLTALQEGATRRNPRAEPLPWETLKGWMHSS
jgi:hypothetical protein